MRKLMLLIAILLLFSGCSSFHKTVQAVLPNSYPKQLYVDTEHEFSIRIPAEWLLEEIPIDKPKDGRDVVKLQLIDTHSRFGTLTVERIPYGKILVKKMFISITTAENGDKLSARVCQLNLRTQTNGWHKMDVIVRGQRSLFFLYFKWKEDIEGQQRQERFGHIIKSLTELKPNTLSEKRPE
jgi:hypothetical protein